MIHRIPLVLAVGFWTVAVTPLAAAADSTLPIGDTEGQPLAANVRRVIESLKFLGTPLPEEEVSQLESAAKARDAKQLQQLLDPRVLLLAHINPESRVKVRRGPAAAELQ